MPRTKKQPQMHLEEELLDRPELARLLDDRESAKEEAAPYIESYRGLDKQVKGLIGQLELEDGTYRCGDFVVKLSQSEERHVEFERTTSRRISIKPALT